MACTNSICYQCYPWWSIWASVWASYWCSDAHVTLGQENVLLGGTFVQVWHVHNRSLRHHAFSKQSKTLLFRNKFIIKQINSIQNHKSVLSQPKLERSQWHWHQWLIGYFSSAWQVLYENFPLNQRSIVFIGINIWADLIQPSRCIKASFYIPEKRPNFHITRGLEWQIQWLAYGFCQIEKKKSKSPRKTQKWVGGASPNSDFYFLGKFCFFVFFVLLSCFQILPRKNKNWLGGWLVGWFSDPFEFFSDLKKKIFNLTRLLTNTW